VEIAAEILMIQRALEAEPNRADLHRKLGFLLARQGKTAEAATEFRKALQCSRTSL
jgi:Flp pilus assembly protein TadD